MAPQIETKRMPTRFDAEIDQPRFLDLLRAGERQRIGEHHGTGPKRGYFQAIDCGAMFPLP